MNHKIDLLLEVGRLGQWLLAKLLVMGLDDKCSPNVTEVNAVSRGGVDVIRGIV